uniref:Uncharacterized protein n=1 Tax=Rhizophora mucronata TaxID=61149 RepID=A0A2P2PXA6_RHIMU
MLMVLMSLCMKWFSSVIEFGACV